MVVGANKIQPPKDSKLKAKASRKPSYKRMERREVRGGATKGLLPSCTADGRMASRAAGWLAKQAWE